MGRVGTHSHYIFFMLFPKVALIHYSAFRAISPNIFINNTARTPNNRHALNPSSPPSSQLRVQPDGALLITSDLTVIGPAQLHLGEPKAVGEGAWPLRLSPPDLGVRCGAPGSPPNEQYEAGREQG